MRVLFFCLWFFTFKGVWAFQWALPLSSVQQKEILEKVAPSLGHSFLTQPLALGLREGFQWAGSVKVLPLEGLKSLEKTDSSHELVYQWSFAKGLYRHVDVFFQSSAFMRKQSLQAHGLALKWAFFRGQRQDFVLSLFPHIQWSDFLDSLQSRVLGVDMVLSYHVFYLGSGLLRTDLQIPARNSKGENMTESGKKEESYALSYRVFGGLYKEFARYIFVSTQVSWHKKLSYSFKLGVTF